MLSIGFSCQPHFSSGTGSAAVPGLGGFTTRVLKTFFVVVFWQYFIKELFRSRRNNNIPLPLCFFAATTTAFPTLFTSTSPNCTRHCYTCSSNMCSVKITRRSGRRRRGSRGEKTRCSHSPSEVGRRETSGEAIFLSANQELVG